MFTATLRCGTSLSYEAPSFRPDRGDLVPCRHHGYCVVETISRSRSGGPYGRRACPRAQSELLEWLRQRSEATVHALRRQRFTLRMITEAERQGLVDLDLVAGRVAIRSAATRSSDSSQQLSAPGGRSSQACRSGIN